MSSKNNKWELVVDHTCVLGEGPVWDERSNSIYWVDIQQGHINRYLLPHSRLETISVGQKIGAFALRESGGFILALKNGFATLDFEEQQLKPIADPEAHLPDNRFNDGKCDPQGRFWAGTMDGVNDEKGVASLYTLNTDMSIEQKITEVSTSNGLCWSADGSTFYYIDTPTKQVAAYDFNGDTGAITNKRIIITIPDEEGMPDGMTIDKEGMLWIAFWDGWIVGRYNPLTGKQLHKIELPVARVTSCTFGGEDLTDLYITSAREGLSENDLKQQPLAGSLFVVRNCGFLGMPAIKFKG